MQGRTKRASEVIPTVQSRLTIADDRKQFEPFCSELSHERIARPALVPVN